MVLTNEELQAGMPEGWAGSPAGISREYAFASYEAGTAFAMRVALMAQRADHHPDRLVIGWKKVQVVYVTHSQGGVTQLDLQAARAVNDAFAAGGGV